MTQYTRKPTVVEAFQYDRQPQKDWPQWLKDYQVATPMGFQGVGAGPGVLLVPNKNGPTINVTVGEWVVYENGVLLVFRNDLFEAAFEGAAATEAPAAAEAPAETVTPIVAKDEIIVPAADTAETPVADKGGKKKPAGDKPAEDAPAAEA